MNNKNFWRYLLVRIFSVREWDNHWVFFILGLHFKIKIKRPVPKSEVQRFGLNVKKRAIPLVISLTSFPARINAVIDTIKSLLLQTCLPDYLILWLAKEEFPNGLPTALTALQTLGLEIRWCDNLRSYKKLIPTLQLFPKAIIVTFDDDIYYAEDTLARLYENHLRFPNEVIAGRIGRIGKTKTGFGWLSERVRWGRDYDNPSYFNVLIGYGGCLYPPGCLSTTFLARTSGFELLPTHDDLYFWGAAVANRVKIRGIQISRFTYLPATQQYGLCKVNRQGKGISINEGLTILFQRYPELQTFLANLNEN